MPVIRLETRIDAPPARCFDLARSVDVHLASTSRTKERAIAGTTIGLLGLGDWVTWEARHFGITQRLTAKITRFEPPHLFEDCMVEGAFASFRHLHRFDPDGPGTCMVDVFDYRSPLGPLGRVADVLFLERYLSRFLRARADYLKHTAETLGRPAEGAG
jgi:ligand-binding SRPBCC domain-containing protein